MATEPGAYRTSRLSLQNKSEEDRVRDLLLERPRDPYLLWDDFRPSSLTVGTQRFPLHRQVKRIFFGVNNLVILSSGFVESLHTSYFQPSTR